MAQLFTERLKALMAESGKTLMAISQECGLSHSVLSKYRNGRVPDTKSLKILAEYFGVTADYLLGFTDVKKPNIDVQAIQLKTGLSEKSIEILGNQLPDSAARVLSSLIESPDFKIIMQIIDEYLKIKKMEGMG